MGEHSDSEGTGVLGGVCCDACKRPPARKAGRGVRQQGQLGTHKTRTQVRMGLSCVLLPNKGGTEEQEQSRTSGFISL